MSTEPRVQVTEYEVNAIPEGVSSDAYVWSVRVQWRGKGLWAVTHHSECLGRDGTWDYEPQPSSREDDWLTDHRFTEEEALQLAKEAAPTIKVNGMTALDIIAKHSGRPES